MSNVPWTNTVKLPQFHRHFRGEDSWTPGCACKTCHVLFGYDQLINQLIM